MRGFVIATAVVQRAWEILTSRRVQDTHLVCSISRAEFEQMALLLGPCVGAKGRETVEQALQKWNPSCRLSTSRHTGQIRCA